MELLCAVDLLGGSAVRLVQGEFDQRTDYGDPVGLVRRYLEDGARWVHVVDLDAARSGQAANRPSVLAILAAAHEAGAAVEVGGGVRRAQDVSALVEAGCDRVVLGTAAVEDPDLALACAEAYPGRVAVGLDYRRRPDGTLEPAVRGWLAGTGVSVDELVARFAGSALEAFVVTAIERDGTLAGPDVEGLASVLDATSVPVVASGGVGVVGDLATLAALRSPRHGRSLAGAVVGKALVAGAVTVKEALAACTASV